MGTSKSYITLKSKESESVKRGLGSYLKKGNVSKENVVSRFVKSLRNENFFDYNPDESKNKTYAGYQYHASRVIEIIELVDKIKSTKSIIDFVNELKEKNIEIETPVDLIRYLTKDDVTASTINAIIFNKALEITFIELGLNDFDQLEQIDLRILIDVILVNIVSETFEQRYYEEILKKLDGDAKLAQEKIIEIKSLISSVINPSFAEKTPKPFFNDRVKLEKYVTEKCKEIYEILERIDMYNENSNM